MNELKLSLWESSSNEMLSDKQKEVILWLMVFLCSVIIIPVTIKNFILGHYLVAFSASVFFISVLINTYFNHFKSFMPIHYNIVTSLCVVSLFISIYKLGIAELFWVFPVTITITFVLPTKTSYIFNAIIVTGAIAIAFYQFNIDVATKFTLALLASLTMVILVLNIIKNLTKKLGELSIKDHLTGALNRRQLLFHLNDCIEQKIRFDTNAAIVMLDIDNFKTINDQLGHSTGDLVIKRVSDIISANIRKTDLFFRIGGDEFILLTRSSTLNETNFLARKICRLVNNEHVNENENHKLSISIGVAKIIKKTSALEWMEHADKALFQAKNAGRNCVKTYTAA